MKLGIFERTWNGLHLQNKFLIAFGGAMLICNLLLGIALIAKDKTVVLVPPRLLGEASVTADDADAAFKESFGLSLATMLGNVTPTTAPFLADNVSRYVAPEAHREMVAAVTEQADQIKGEQISIQFAPKEVFYHPGIKKVIVSGDYWIRGARNSEQKMVRTYELGLDVRNYSVQLVSLKTYEGPWSAPNEKELEAQIAAAPKN
ncbi:TraE/TraK family type IV conjugative transfer system protein [Pseudoxanthomonas japonensis]|uniref:TraE/TraK family type IV conjugative transfer system protein n=1 Tax=Pseudoxanthomonas japonensis TaxID=69284 RepID=UPI00374888AB